MSEQEGDASALGAGGQAMRRERRAQLGARGGGGGAVARGAWRGQSRDPLRERRTRKNNFKAVKKGGAMRLFASLCSVWRGCELDSSSDLLGGVLVLHRHDNLRRAQLRHGGALRARGSPARPS